MNSLTSQWVDKAEEDFAAALRLVEPSGGETGLPNLACFHAAQCVEKYAKAFLPDEMVSTEGLLIALFGRCAALDSDFKPYRADFAWLDRYGIQSLYPGARTTEAEADEAVRAMQRVRTFVRGKLRLE